MRKDGYYRTARQLLPTTGGKDDPPDGFQFAEGQLSADWPDLRDVEVLVFHSWTMDRLRVKSVDEATHTVTFVSPTLSNNWFFDLRAGKRFILENVASALERPGEWYLDRKTGVLTYIPLPGETPETAEVIAPRLERLVVVRGQADLGLAAEHLILRGLTFAHSNWNTPPGGQRIGQSEVDLWGAVSLDGARDCLLDACKITHIGTYAVELVSGCSRNRIVNCEITDLAAGGVKIGETTLRAESDPALTSWNTVSNCLVAHGGRMHAAGMGVWIGHSPYNVVEHNEIADFYQTGISAGWSWGYGESQCHDNTIAYNHIHHLGQGVTDDMGGIYTLGLSPGTVLHHNVIHDVSCYGYGGRGIYFDEGTSDLLAENNIVYRTDTGAFMHHYGRDDRVFNNIFALARGGQLDRLREEEHNSFTFERNIVYYDYQGTLLAENWNNDRFVMNRNLYWCTGISPVTFGQWSLEQWHARGHDRGSRIADPLFVDPKARDFRLKPDSPAHALGFQDIDTSQVGRLPRPAELPEEPLAPRAFPEKAAPAQIEIDEDMEDLAVGEPLANAVLSEENAEATIRVSDETAASGKHSLKFIDAAGQKANYNPHLYFQPNLGSGTIEGHFDLRLEPGMSFYTEWRDVTVFYRSGPLLRMRNGVLEAGGKVLMDLPLGEWVGFDIVATLGEHATGMYDLTVTLPGEPPREFPGLTYDPEFRVIHWLLFTAEGTEPGVCYVDNIRLRRRT